MCIRIAGLVAPRTQHIGASTRRATGREYFAKTASWRDMRFYPLTGSRCVILLGGFDDWDAYNETTQQEWNGLFFKRVGLSQLGLVVQLGHTPGSACTAMRRGNHKFTLIDVTGIHTVAVQFCECDSRITHRQQLMRVCWWPATVRDPSTCATFNVIRLFQNMNCLGKISAFHFLKSLELLTNNDGLTPPPVSEILRAVERGLRKLP